MKAVRVLLVAALAVSLAAPAVFAEPRQLLQGTQIHLQLLTDISTSSSKNGDPFMAIVTEPVAIGDQQSAPLFHFSRRSLHEPHVPLRRN